MQQEHLMKRSLSSYIFKKLEQEDCFVFLKFGLENKILPMLTPPDCCTVENVCVNVCVCMPLYFFARTKYPHNSRKMEIGWLVEVLS